MRIAVAVEEKKVSGHFGHCEGFDLYEVQDGNIVQTTFLQNPGHKPGFLPKYLAEQNINVIIAGGMGEMAQTLFNENNIEVVVGVSGDGEEAVKTFINGELKSTGSVCKDHDHSDSCGNH